MIFLLQVEGKMAEDWVRNASGHSVSCEYEETIKIWSAITYKWSLSYDKIGYWSGHGNFIPKLSAEVDKM